MPRRHGLRLWAEPAWAQCCKDDFHPYSAVTAAGKFCKDVFQPYRGVWGRPDSISLAVRMIFILTAFTKRSMSSVRMFFSLTEAYGAVRPQLLQGFLQLFVKDLHLNGMFFILSIREMAS
jgi:hypothetical protein